MINGKKYRWNLNPLWTNGRAENEWKDLALYFYPIFTAATIYYIFKFVLLGEGFCPQSTCQSEIALPLWGKFAALMVSIPFLVHKLLLTIYQSAREYRHTKSAIHLLAEGEKFFKLDSRVPFYRHKVFSWALRVPFYLSMGTVLLLFAGDDSPGYKDISLTASGFSELMRLFSMPMYLLALMGASGIMVARFHRSKQLSESLIEAERKNNFDMRFRHEEEFGGFVEKLPSYEFDVKKGQVKRVALLPGRALYRSIFSENTQALNRTTSNLVGVGAKLAQLLKIMDDKILVDGGLNNKYLSETFFSQFPFSCSLVQFENGEEGYSDIETVTSAQYFEIIYGVLSLIGTACEFLEGDVNYQQQFQRILGKRITPNFVKIMQKNGNREALNLMGIIGEN